MEDQHIVLPNISLWPHLGDAPIENSRTLGLFSILDGHGGQHASLYASKHLPDLVHNSITTCCRPFPDLLHDVLLQSICQLDKAFCLRAEKLKQTRVGTTLVAALVDLETGNGCVAWLGDSRCDLISVKKQNGNLQFNTTPLTFPLHRPDVDSERKRIEAFGGYVSGDAETIARVNGQLSVSRAIGDLSYKTAGLISAEPQLNFFKLPSFQTDDEVNFLLLSSDGLWEGLSTDQLQTITCESIKSNHNDTLGAISNALTTTAAEKSGDNLTCILIARHFS